MDPVIMTPEEIIPWKKRKRKKKYPKTTQQGGHRS